MAKYPGGVTVSGYIAPSDTADIYATHKAQFGYGGYRSATDLTARDAITTLRREEGMVVYVISEKKEYRLVGGILNTNWVEIVSSGGGTQTPAKQNYLIFNDLTERDNYSAVSTDAAIGQLCYVIGTDKEYRLIGGTTNADWYEVVNDSSGNYLLVNNLTERDNIAANIRKIGQICYITSTDEEYRLVGGITNSNWVKLTNTGTGTSSGTTKQNYVIVDTITDVENYPVANRFIGLDVYVKDADREFRLVKGIDNTNWVEQGLAPVNNGDIINNNTNNYFNTFGCLNLSLLKSSIIDTAKDVDPDYKDPTGTTIPSTSDTNEFTFTINKSEYWVNDWIYFSGSTLMDSTKKY